MSKAQNLNLDDALDQVLDLSKIHRMDAPAKKRGRPANPDPASRIFMKWPEDLLQEVHKFAKEDGLSYQNFIRTTVAKEIKRRKEKQGA